MTKKKANLGLGPTGNFPEGKLTEGDAGELVIGVSVEQDNIIVHFGTDVRWIGLPPANAIAFAELIIARAKEIPNGKK